jgi:hypothetical protein
MSKKPLLELFELKSQEDGIMVEEKGKRTTDIVISGKKRSGDDVT